MQGFLYSVLVRKTTPTKMENDMLVHDDSDKPGGGRPISVKSTMLPRSINNHLLLLKSDEVERFRGQI